MYSLTLKSEENIRCDGKVFLKMCLKSYGFYDGILVASQTRDEIFLYPNLPVNGEFLSQRPVTRSFDLCTWINDWVNNREAGELRRHRAHYDVIVMQIR